jgi:hypothetical protein
MLAAARQCAYRRWATNKPRCIPAFLLSRSAACRRRTQESRDEMHGKRTRERLPRILQVLTCRNCWRGGRCCRHHGLAGAQRDDRCCQPVSQSVLAAHTARRRGCICGELTALDQHPPHLNFDRCQPHPTSNGPQPHPHSNHSDSRNDSTAPLSAPSVHRWGVARRKAMNPVVVMTR